MKNIAWFFIPRMLDQREAWVKHYVAGSALMVFPWDKTSRTGRDTGFSYTCAVNLGLWTKVNKNRWGRRDSGNIFHIYLHNSQMATYLPAIFWYSNKCANNNNTIKIFTLRKMYLKEKKKKKNLYSLTSAFIS